MEQQSAAYDTYDEEERARQTAPDPPRPGTARTRTAGRTATADHGGP
ncbi:MULTISPECIES: hypothetical protein [Streptomyces]|nr:MULTISPECIES: hypothetical protein [Streptomyces]